MAMTIVEMTRPATGGVDTHADVHVAAVVDANGGVLGVEAFPTTPRGYAALGDWLTGFGAVVRVSKGPARMAPDWHGPCGRVG
jgi:hypothetical protein